MSGLLLDYNNMLADVIGPRGIETANIAAHADRFREVHADVQRRREQGRLGFFELPHESQVVEQIRTFADGIGQAFDTVVVLGIGGSALGTIALQSALLRPHWNELDDEGRDYFPRLYVLDNIDPSTIGPLLDRLDARRTLFNVISKSGTTAETMAQYMIVRDRLAALLDDEGVRGHLVFTTDPEKGVLRRIAEDDGIATLPIPANVGGRFSVLSAVGLLPAALAGIDIESLLAGAIAMEQRCATDDMRANPAGMFAALQHIAHGDRGAGIHVMMAYTDRLYSVCDWYRQLWAESLGKRLDLGGNEIYIGPTPIKALGATDQHSQVQLYMEGPFDKTITLLGVRETATDLAIPHTYADVPELGYLGGRTLGELLDAERQATAGALARAGRMNMSIELPRIDAFSIGELFMMMQIATVYAGAFYGVDPLDQPGVELGKQLTYGLMGRAGSTAPDFPTSDPRFMIR